MDRLTPRQERAWICLLLAAATLLTFWPLTTHEFISYDDGIYLTGNAHVRQGLSWNGIHWALTTGYAGNWHPLTWISHMADAQLFGMQPGWHHLVSVVLHTITTVLLFLLFARMTGAVFRSAFIAALFALHPLHVQSVAWAAERKDVLSALFFVLTLMAYASYTTRAAKFRPSSKLFFGLSLLCFALGLMSKPMLVTVPFVLLLLDYWPLRRLSIPAAGGSKGVIPLVVEKIPFIVLTILSCVITLSVQNKGGAVVTTEALSLGGRTANALCACVDYLRQTFWPTDLALLYPLDEIPGAGALAVSGIILIGVTAWTLWNFRRRPYLPVGWLWFLGMLVPVIGIVQVGMQQRADRYTYLPLIGIFVMLTWEFSERLGPLRSARMVLAAVAAVVLIACLAITREQIGCWQDSEHIFARALQVSPSSYVAANDYGLAVLDRGRVAEAIAIFEKAVEMKPTLDAARCGLGMALMQQGQYEEAAKQFNQVLALQPDNITARLQIGILLGRQGKLPEAAESFSRALTLSPNDPSVHNNFGNVLMLQGKNEEALKQFADAVRLQPDYAIAYNNLATCCTKLGRLPEAIDNYQKTLQLRPNSLEALNNLAWILATGPDARFRDGTQAVQLALRAGELSQYKNPVVLGTLAAAFAESGQFQEAMSYATLAGESIPPGQSQLKTRLVDMLALFQNRQPYRVSDPKPDH